MEFIEAWQLEDANNKTLPGAPSPKPMLFAAVEQASSASEKAPASVKGNKSSKFEKL